MKGPNRKNGFDVIIPLPVKIRKAQVEKRMKPLIEISIEARRMGKSIGYYKEYLRERGKLYV